MAFVASPPVTSEFRSPDASTGGLFDPHSRPFQGWRAHRESQSYRRRHRRADGRVSADAGKGVEIADLHVRLSEAAALRTGLEKPVDLLESTVSATAISTIRAPLDFADSETGGRVNNGGRPDHQNKLAERAAASAFATHPAATARQTRPPGRSIPPQSQTGGIWGEASAGLRVQFHRPCSGPSRCFHAA